MVHIEGKSSVGLSYLPKITDIYIIEMGWNLGKISDPILFNCIKNKLKNTSADAIENSKVGQKYGEQR